MQIKTKVGISICIIFIITAGIVLAIFARSWNRSLDIVTRQSLRSARVGFDNLVENDVRALSATLAGLIGDETFRDPYVNKDLEGLKATTAPLFSQFKNIHGITHWYFIDLDGTCYLRAHNHGKRGDLIERATFKKAKESNSFGSGIELGKTAFALRVVYPYLDHDNNLIGYMELGEEIEHFFEILKDETDADYGLLVSKEFLNRDDWASVRKTKGLADNWDDHPNLLMIDSTRDSDLLTSYQGDLLNIPTEGKFLDLVEQGEKAFIRGAFPINDAAGRKVGAIFVLKDISEIYIGMKGDRMRVGAFLIVAMLVMAVFLLAMVQRLVFSRFANVIDVATRVVGGDYESKITVTANDEVGEVENLLEQFRAVFVNTLELAEKQNKDSSE